MVGRENLHWRYFSFDLERKMFPKSSQQTSYWLCMGHMTISSFREHQKHEYLAFLPFYGRLALPVRKLGEGSGYGVN